MDVTIHGGDIYRNKVLMDYSVNVNLGGIPKGIRLALMEAIDACETYPDPQCEELRRALEEKYHVSKEAIVVGNGASELFLGIIRALEPKKILLPIPSFYGYEYVAKSCNSEILYYQMKEEENFTLGEDLLDGKSDLVLFLGNPNNPTGKKLSYEFLEKLCIRAVKQNIFVVIDECFLEFTGEESFINRLPKECESHVILVRAFTKIFAIPGVRLGYMFCKNLKLVEDIKRQLPEWNVSSFGQKAGVAALKEEDYIKSTLKIIKEEKEYLIQELRKLGIRVWDSDGNFLLFYTQKPVYDLLLKEKILIRNCENYKGLTHGYYRIAIKSHEENKKLIEAMGKIYG